MRRSRTDPNAAEAATTLKATRNKKDHRLAALVGWLGGIDAVDGATLRPASDDASFRRYFRVQTGQAGQESFIVMDAPPEQEDCRPFIRIAGYLEAMKLNAPRIVEANLDDGFLLITDLGSTQYLDALREDPAAAPALYADALHTLSLLQKRGAAYQSSLPPYDEELLRFELSILRNWLYEKHLGLTFTEEEEESWQDVCDLLVRNALDQPRVFVHRDYHSRNLMLAGPHNRGNNPGILDFQDALEGPLAYDLVSLLKDCYVRLPQQQVREWALGFYADLDASIQEEVDEELFMRYFDLMGVQRHLKASGIFARLKHRDGKPGYMADVPRTLGYIVDLAPQYPELGWLVELISERCLPALEARSLSDSG